MYIDCTFTYVWSPDVPGILIDVPYKPTKWLDGWWCGVFSESFEGKGVFGLLELLIGIVDGLKYFHGEEAELLEALSITSGVVM